LRRSLVFAGLILLLSAQMAVALPSLMGFRGVNRVVDARPVGIGEIMFGLMGRYWASTNEIEALEFHSFGPVYHDTIAVSDKEHYGDGYFAVGYGLTDFMELGARLSYVTNYYERDLVQPRGMIAGRWDGVDGLGDVRVGMKLGFTPTPSNNLLWLGLQNWWGFAPSKNETVTSEDYCGLWFDGMPMYDIRRPTISTGHTSYGVGGLLSFDMADVWPSSRIRLHANAGWAHYKQNFNFTDFRVQMGPGGYTFSDSTDVNLVVEDNVLEAGAAIEFPTKFAVLFLEYSLQECLDREGQNSTAYLTPGIRFVTSSGALVDVTFDLGMTDFFGEFSDLGHGLYQTGPVTDEQRMELAPMPFGSANDWGIGFDIAFSSDLIHEATPPTQGRISGMVTSSVDGKPVAAEVFFPGTTMPSVFTDETSGFYSVMVPGGSTAIAVRSEGYIPGSATVIIDAGQSVVKDFALIPTPAGGIVTGTVTSSEDGAPLVATVSVTDAPEAISVSSGADGVYQLQVPSGTWTIKAEAPDYLPRSQPVVIPADQTVVVNLELRPALVEGQVLSFNNIYFDVGSATLKPESYGVLDGVVETLLDNPDATVRIAGHTDSDGSESFNQTLSEQRAQSVFTYLVNHGVSARRLSTIGYGETAPVVPNTSSANKAQNRRIEFTVLSVN